MKMYNFFVISDTPFMGSMWRKSAEHQDLKDTQDQKGGQKVTDIKAHPLATTEEVQSLENISLSNADFYLNGFYFSNQVFRCLVNINHLPVGCWPWPEEHPGPGQPGHHGAPTGDYQGDFSCKLFIKSNLFFLPT